MDSVNGIAGNSTNPFSDISGPTSEPSGDSKNSRPPTSPRQREGVQGLPKRNNTPPLQSQGASAEEAEAIGESSAVAPKAASEPPTEPQTRNGSPVPQGPTKNHLSQSFTAPRENKTRPGNGNFKQASSNALQPRQQKNISSAEKNAAAVALRKSLISNNDAMQKILTDILTEMSTGKNANPMSREHAAVLEHLDKQLKPTPSKVPGVSLTGFSHVRYFDTVMPHDFAPTTTYALKIQIIEDSLAYAKHPTSPAPPNVFTLLQFQNNEKPEKDTQILDPEHAIHGRDCNGNHLVGLHAGHADMPALNGQYQASQRTSIHFEKNKNSWAETAWMAALVYVSHDQLKADLEDEKTDIPEDRKGHIAALQTAAKALQTARLHAAELKKDGKRGEADRYFEQAHNNALKAIREHARPLTPAVLASESGRGGHFMGSESVGDHARMLSLMSALGVPAITMQGRNTDAGPANMMYHAADMTHAEEAFNSADGDKKRDFLAKEMQSGPVVEIDEKGFTLTFPEMPIKSENVKSDAGTPEPKDENSKQKPSAAE